MKDLIEREKVLETFLSRGSGYITELTMLDMINEIPAADVQPVKRGRWIDIYEYCEMNDCIPSGLALYYWCSECMEEQEKTSDFCPHCGADMRQEENDKEVF